MKSKSSLTTILLGCLFALVMSNVVSRADDKYTPFNAWEKGDYTLRQDCFASVVKSVDKKVFSREQSRIMFTWKITAADVQADASQTLTMKISNVMTRYESNGNELDYFDSANALNKPFMRDVFKAIMQVELTVLLKEGEVAKVDGCDNLWKDVPQPSAQDEELFLTRLQSYITADMFKQLFETLSCLDTVDEVAVGDTWKNETLISFPVVGDKTLQWNCKFDSLAKSGKTPLACVSGSSALAFDLTDTSHAELKTEQTAKYNVKSYFPVEVISRATVAIESKTERKGADGETIVVVEKIAGMNKSNLTVVRR
ncbi:MAG: DUF6263 family protein [Planctomycetia bacterium]|nr:DUF6263 family protein [Planctomycetia bacterium]